MDHLHKSHVTLAVLLNQVREEAFQGRAHLVAPVVALMEMVLRCSNCLPGGELIPAEEIEASLPLWNGVPLPINHPRMNGEPISARDRRVQDQQVIGHFFEPMFAAGRLTGELWVDIALAEASTEGANILARLRDDSRPTLEVSTSYFAERVPRRGDFKGEPFEAVQRNIIPDHLALLPDEVGACSIQDGCGAPRLNCDCAVNDGLVTNPFPNEHACRIRQPGDFTEGSFRRIQRDADGRRLDIIIGRPKGQTTTATQAFRYPKDDWSVSAARAHCSDQDGMLFEPATEAARHPGDCPPGQHLGPQGRCVPNTKGNTMKTSSKITAALATIGSALGINLGDKMDREKTIKALCANDACPFEAAQLQDFSDDQLTALAATYLKEEKKGDTDAQAEEKKAAAAKLAAENKAAEEKAAAEKKAAEEKKAATLNAAGLDAEVQAGLKVLAKFGDRLEGLFAQEEVEKAALVKALTANAACPFDQADLEGFTLEKLEKLVYALSPADYSGRGGVYQKAAGDEDAPPEAPKIVTAALKEEKKED